MKTISMFFYSIIAYLIAFVSLLFWILSVSNLIPAISIDRNPEILFSLALIKNVSLVGLFGIQHSIMARRSFKKWFSSILPLPIERSTYVLLSGLLLGLLVWQWEPMGGSIWNITQGSMLFYSMYVLFFTGWSILFISTFLTNHFDLFGLRQTYFELIKKPYKPLELKIIAFYKTIRHPLYFGAIVGLWATPKMSLTHLFFALLLTGYIIIGSILEEKDLIRDFGDQYLDYKKSTGKFIPYFKRNKSNSTQV